MICTHWSCFPTGYQALGDGSDPSSHSGDQMALREIPEETSPLKKFLPCKFWMQGSVWYDHCLFLTSDNLTGLL